MPENTWKTALTSVAPNQVRVRGYDIAELMGRCSFGQVVYLLLRGEMPDEKVGRLMDAILVSSIDHGASPPSALAARTVASTGATLSGAVGAGILAINKSHGGAVEDCARALTTVVRSAEAEGSSLVVAAEKVLADYKARKVRVAGFGHRMHKADPRTARLFELAEEAGVSGRYIEAARAVEAALEKQQGKKLPINVDGAIGAVLSELGFEPQIMNGFFMISRAAGLVAHVGEEWSREKPMRKINPTGYEYDGPAPRGLKARGSNR
jgi:citrate synthase